MKKLGCFIAALAVAATGVVVGVAATVATPLGEVGVTSSSTTTTRTPTTVPIFTAPATTLPATPPPTPAVTPAPTSQDTHLPNISAADCQWAISVMSADMALDSAWARLHAGSVQAVWADRWSQVLATLHAACASPPTYPDAMTCLYQVGWLDAARIGHDSDALAHPENRAWDRYWSASYERLIVLYHGLCP